MRFAQVSYGSVDSCLPRHSASGLWLYTTEPYSFRNLPDCSSGCSDLLGINIVILSPINLRQTLQLCDVVCIGVIVTALGVPNVKRQQRGNQLSRFRVAAPQRQQPLVMRSHLWSVRAIQLILNSAQNRRLASLF